MPPAVPAGWTIPGGDDALPASVGLLSNRAGSSIDGLVVRSGLRSAAGSSGSPYVYGVSGVCGANTDYYGNIRNLIPQNSHEVVASSAYGLVTAYLAAHAPNFYAESTVGDIDLSDATDRMCFRVYADSEGACVMPTFNRFEPPKVVIKADPGAWWQNLPSWR